MLTQQIIVPAYCTIFNPGSVKADQLFTIEPNIMDNNRSQQSALQSLHVSNFPEIALRPSSFSITWVIMALHNSLSFEVLSSVSPHAKPRHPYTSSYGMVCRIKSLQRYLNPDQSCLLVGLLLQDIIINFEINITKQMNNISLRVR